MRSNKDAGRLAGWRVRPVGGHSVVPAAPGRARGGPAGRSVEVRPGDQPGAGRLPSVNPIHWQARAAESLPSQALLGRGNCRPCSEAQARHRL